jgi:hypothetical protein
VNRMIPLLCCVVAAVLAMGCGEESGQSGVPQHYSEGGLNFDYPGNWAITRDTVAESIHHVTINSPGNAIISIYLFPEEAAPGIEEFAHALSSSITDDDLMMGSLGESTFSTMELVGGYELMSEKFSVSIMNEIIPHTRTYRRRNLGDRICFIMDQVADEDRPKVKGGFEMVYGSLRYGGE